MIINLLDISEDGHTFTYKKGEEKEFDQLIADAVDSLRDYNFSIKLTKTGDIYTAEGDISLQKEDVCSLCGADMNIPIKKHFTEFIMNETRADQKGHAPHSGLNLENEQEVTFVQNNELNLGEFVREQFAVVVPAYPKCPDQKGCAERQAENKRYMDAKNPQGHPGFAVLNKLKKN